MSTERRKARGKRGASPRILLRLSSCALALGAGCATAATRPSSAPRPDAAGEVVATEHAFAAAAARDGVRDAFLAFADDSAIALNPEPANAKQVWRARPRTPGRLTWYPAVARAARSGDLGFTTGPYASADSAGNVRGHGEYVTIWRRTAAGWRFVIDLGTQHPRPDAPQPEWSPSAARVGRWNGSADADAARSLRKADSAFAAHAASAGFAAALREWGDVGMRLLRQRSFPRAGLDAALAAAAEDGARRYTARPMQATASAAGDLGWTWGEYEALHPGAGRRETGHYVRIWTREPGGPWRVVLDIASPRPPERDE